MDNKPSLVFNISWTFVGNVVYAFTQWGILTSIAKFGSTSMTGEFALGLAVSAPVFMFLNFQLRVIQASDAKDQFEFGQYCGLRIISVFLAVILLGIFIAVSNYTPNQKLIILLITCAKACESICDLSYGLLQKNECMQKISYSMILRGLVGLVVFSGVLYFTQSLITALFLQCITWCMVMLFYDISNMKKFAPFKPVFKFKLLKPLLFEGIPMGVTSLLISLNTNIPRYFIKHFNGSYGLGIYIAIESLQAIPQTLVDALSHSIIPKLSQYFARGEIKKFVKTIRVLMVSGLAMGAAGIVVASLIGEWVLVLLYNTDYASQAYLLVGFMILSGIMHIQTFLFFSINSIRMFRAQMSVNLSKVFFTLVVSAVCVKNYGIKGALAASMTSAVFSVVVYALMLRRALWLRKNEKGIEWQVRKPW